jgi:hypothetical protein
VPGYLHHAYIANKIIEKLGMKGNEAIEFMLGSVLPDATGKADDKFDAKTNGATMTPNTTHIGGIIVGLSPIAELSGLAEKCKGKDNMVLWGYLSHLFVDCKSFSEHLARYFTVDDKTKDEKTPAQKDKLPISRYPGVYSDYDKIDAYLVKQHPELYKKVEDMYETFDGFMENLKKQFAFRLGKAREYNNKNENIGELDILDLNDTENFLDGVVDDFIKEYGKDIKPNRNKGYER